MIRANVRYQLGRDDAQLALRVIGRASAEAYREAERALRDQGIDALLDDPRLLSGLLEAPQGMQASYPLFAYVIVRHALLAAEMDDRILSDYVASLVLHFGLRDRAQRIGDVDDDVYDSLAAIAAAVEIADARRSFLARVHLGNYALWLSGLFPDHIAYRHWRRGGPDIDYYDDMGRRGFTLAAAHRLAAEYGVTHLFNRAAEHFPRVRMALNHLSDALLFPNTSSPERLLRQVSNAARWRQM